MSSRAAPASSSVATIGGTAVGGASASSVSASVQALYTAISAQIQGKPITIESLLPFIVEAASVVLGFTNLSVADKKTAITQVLDATISKELASEPALASFIEKLIPSALDVAFKLSTDVVEKIEKTSCWGAIAIKLCGKKTK